MLYSHIFTRAIIIFISSFNSAYPVLLRTGVTEIPRLAFSEEPINWHHREPQWRSHRASSVSDSLSIHMRLLLKHQGQEGFVNIQ